VDPVKGGVRYVMGPPAYGRSTSQPYSRPGAPTSERKQTKQDGRRESRAGEWEESRREDPVNLLLPDFSDLTNTFEVEIKRNSLGLGFSISGGTEAPSPWTNLIRVKKIFPLQPAWETSKLRVGDIILRVSGIPLTSLTLRQALDILRTSPPLTLLQVCRVSDASGNSWSSLQTPRQRSSVVRSYSYGQQPCNTYCLGQQCRDHSPERGRQHDTEEWRPALSLCSADSMDIEISPPSPSPPSSREWSPDENDSTLSLLQPVEQALRNSRPVVGQFSISLTKVSGSLGFTLRQLDDTVLKHTIKALVREPALSDGRLKAGDKLLSANGVELASFSHQEVIQFLRQCPETVSLELYRDASRSQTPLSPDQSLFDSLVAGILPQDTRRNPLKGMGNARTSQSPSRKLLRYEAAELVRSLQSSRTSLEKAGLGGSSNSGSYSGSTGTLGRRLGRPYSPALKERKEMLPTSPQPTVESPLSPQNSSAPASLSQGVTRAFQGMHLEEEGRLFIEEVEAGGSSNQCSPQVQEVLSAPQSPQSGSLPASSQSVNFPRSSSEHYLIQPATDHHKPDRPNDLKFSTQSKRQGFVFNNWNLNQNKF